jgi:hypothetical protein
VIYCRIAGCFLDSLIKMHTKIVLAMVTLLCVVSSINAKRLFYDNDNDMELSDKKARMFLRSMMNDDDDDSPSFGTREAGKNCVPCKFGINPCCAPNVCVKKSFRPDECMEVKPGK